jgi:hypothetical protein
MLMGTARGGVRLQPLSRPFGTAAGPQPWEAALHDCGAAVSGVALAHDDSVLISAAHDGTLLVQVWTLVKSDSCPQANDTCSSMLKQVVFPTETANMFTSLLQAPVSGVIPDRAALGAKLRILDSQNA